MKFCKYFLSIALFFVGVISYAQQKSISGLAAQPAALKSPTGPIWTKRVSRVIYLGDSTNYERRKVRNENSDLPLAEIFYNEIQAGRITAYSAFDSRFTSMLTKTQVYEQFHTRPDTIVVEDPVSGQSLKKVVTKEPNFEAITKFRVLEEWVFDRQTGRTTIQILGIAPVKQIYGEDGEFRGLQTCYWLKYNDVRDILATYEQNHAECNVALAVWKDYFSEDEVK